MKYVLIGSLGNVTKPLAEQLIAEGHEVIVVSSKISKTASINALGAEAAIGSVEDIDFLTRTFTGADAVFTLIPPIFDAKVWKEYIHSIGKNFAAAIKASGVKKVVNLSSLGAHLSEGGGPISGLHQAAEELNALPDVDVRHLRPAFFYVNLLSSIDMIKHAGIFGNNYGADTPVDLVHPLDIARVAAEELTRLDFTGHSVRYIVSDERTSKEIASILGSAVGKPELTYVEFSDDDAVKGGMQAGLSEDVARNFMEMGSALRNGILTADYIKHKGAFEKTKLEDFAKEFAVAYANG